MQAPEAPLNEAARLIELCDLSILDTPPEERFDKITRIAQEHFKVPIVLVSLVDQSRQWFKSIQGLDATETPREISFCGHAILGDEVFYVPNTLEDPRFADNPLVTGPPHIRFYAGAPLSTPNGLKIGTLCIIDTVARTLSDHEFGILRDLADCVEQEIGHSRLLGFSVDLETEKARLGAVLNTVVEGIVTIDAKGVIETFNPAAERIFGYTASEVIGQNVKTLMPEPYHGEHDGYLHSYVNTGDAKVIGIGREVIGQRKNGSTFPMELAVSEMAVAGARMFTGIVRDITARKQAEAELRDRESRVRAIVDTVVDGIVTIDAKGVIETFNPAAERIFGYPSREVIGRNVKILMPEPYHGEHDGYLHSYVKTGDAKVIGIGREVIGQRKDGSTFPMELAVSEMAVAGARMFTGIVRDITERKQVDKAKAEFISTVSHELRTPLTSIKGSLGLVRSGAVGALPEKLGRMLDIAYNNSDRLIRLINDILDIEKLESGMMEYKMAPVALGALLEAAIEENRGFAEAHGVRFMLSGEQQDATVNGDHDRLMQVLANLMSNAVKFSPKDAEVDVTLTQQDGNFRISVTDHGPGVPTEFRDKIFGRFSQADSSDSRQKGGTGLGLNITKSIVEHHGGSVSFKTKAGDGATFYVDLPKSETTKPVSSPTRGVSPGFHILHVEDDQDILDIVSSVVGDFAVTTPARTLSEAKYFLAQEEFDLMVLDIFLPDGDGEDLLPPPARMDGSPTPVVVFSVKDISELKPLNANAVLVKSRTSNELLIETIKTAINANK